MKTILEGEQLLVTGQNIYPEASTSVFWNSLSSQAEIVPGSFNDENSQLKVTVPCCLPDYNKVVLCNKIGCITGTQTYHFIGAPEIDSFTPSQQFWSQVVIVKGNHFDDITGIFVDTPEGRKQVREYDWPSDKKVALRIPHGTTSGHIQIYTDIGNVSSSGVLRGIAPPIYGTLTSNAGKYYGDEITIGGVSLHKVNRVKLSGIHSDIFMEESDLSNHETTGLSFLLPEGVVDNSAVTLQSQSGYFQNGEFVSNIEEEVEAPDLLKINSIYIQNTSTNATFYNSPITLTGINLDKSKTFFTGYNNQHVEGPPISSGTYYKTVSVPKNIGLGNIVESGYVNDYEETVASPELFYPLPTIQSISKTGWTAGEVVQIEAINAFNAFEAIGITGINLVDGINKSHFVSNPAGSSDGQNYFGAIALDNSSLAQDTEAGHTTVHALINTAMVGVGHPFLVSAYEAQGASRASQLHSELSGSKTYKNLYNLTGQRVLVSGKKPSVSGLSKYKGDSSGHLVVSGSHFFNVTGMTLSSSTESRTIPRSQFLSGLALSFDSLGQTVSVSSLYSASEYISIIGTEEGLNDYEQVHVAVVNLEDFSFTGKSGEISVSTPYYV